MHKMGSFNMICNYLTRRINCFGLSNDFITQNVREQLSFEPIFTNSPGPVPRTTVARWSLFSMIFKTLGLGRQIRQINFGAFGLFSAELSTPILGLCVPCLSMFAIINQPLFLQKPNPKYLFGIGISIWAAKNQRFSHNASVVRGLYYLYWSWGA